MNLISLSGWVNVNNPLRSKVMAYTRGQSNPEPAVENTAKKYEVTITDEIVLEPGQSISVELGEGEFIPSLAIVKGKKDVVKMNVVEVEGDDPEADLDPIFLRPSQFGKNAYYKRPKAGLSIPANSIIRFWDRPLNTKYGEALLLKIRKA